LAMLLRIVRNVMALLTGHVVSKLVSLGCLIFLARQFGVAGFGMFGTVSAYLTLFTIFAECGLSTIMVRDVAQDHTRSAEYFAHLLALRGLLTLLAYGVLLLCGHLFAKEYAFGFIAGYGLMLFPEALRRLCGSLLSAHERMDVIAGLDIFSILCRYSPFFLALWLGKSLSFAFLLLVPCWIGVAGVWLTVTQRVCLTRWFAAVQPAKLWQIFRAGLPFGFLATLSIIYFKSDVVMLAYLQDQVAVGLYESAYKFIEAAMFIPVSLVNVLLPVMARSFLTDKAAYHQVYLHSTRILAMAILPVVIFVCFCAPQIILLVYGEKYLPAAPALQVLIWTLFVIFLNAPVGNILATANLIQAFLPYALANTLLNIGLNALLIPHYSFFGASATTLFTECTGYLTQVWFAIRVVGNAAEIFHTLGKLLLAGALSSLIFSVLRTWLPFPFNGLLLLAAYGATLVGLRIIQAEDTQLVLTLVRKINAKFADRSQNHA